MDILEPPLSTSSQLAGEDKGSEVEWCIVCCSKVKVKPKNEVITGDDCSSVPLVERNLDVVFLLNNLMQVPNNQLESNLKEFGGDPEDWIKLCGKCTQLTRQARKLHQKIKETEKELKSIQKLVITKTRSSSKKSPRNNHNFPEKVDHQNNEIWRRTRAFVKNYGYPFTTTNLDKTTKLLIEGDKLANYLANQQGTSTTTTTSSILIVENCKDDHSATITSPKPAEVDPDPILSDDPDPIENNRKEKDTNLELFPETRKKKKASAYKCKREYKHYERVNGKFKCRHCDELFFAGITCYVHEREKHCTNPGQYVCDICSSKFNSSAYLISHRRSVHKVNKSGSGAPAPVPKKLQVDMPPKRFSCHLCSKSYSTNGTLKYHIQFDHEKRFKESLICRICPEGKAFTSKKDLTIHKFARHKDSEEVTKMREEGINVWVCEVVGCTDKFITESGLESHKKRYHEGKEGRKEGVQRFACVYCGDGFWSSAQLRRHELIHRLKEKGEKPWVCELCGKGFHMPKYLKQHKEVVHWKIKKTGKVEGNVRENVQMNE